MSAAGELPAELSKVIASFSADEQAKLRKLHETHRFDDDQLECFTMNVGPLTAERLTVFQEFIEKEGSKSSKLPKPARALPETGQKKRKPLAPVQTPALAAVSLSLGLTPPSSTEITTTPAKRSRDREVLQDSSTGATKTPSGTTTASGLKVSVKNTVNQGLEKPGVSLVPVQVEMLGDSSLWTDTKHGAYTWMDEALEERAAAQDQRLVDKENQVIEAVRAKHVDEALPVGTVGLPTQQEVILCGRVACEGIDGKLNERSIILEGSKASSNGARVHLMVSDCEKVAAFPGQIVGVVGRTGMSGTTFHARDFVTGIPASLRTEQERRMGSSLHMMVASGPYCLRDGLDYGPLDKLLEHAASVRPQVLVLLGPFLDAGNLQVSCGNTVLPNEDEPRSFEEVYTYHILPRLQRGLQKLRSGNLGGPPTEVLLVPSLDEALCFHPMPQPPLDQSLCVKGLFEPLKKIGVKLLPNPAHVQVGGFRVSLSSADALTPMLREIVLRPAGNKIEEALRLLLHQQTMFPVLPREPPQVSEPRSQALDFPGNVLPDLCVFPSLSGNANGFFVDNSVFVNPGLLCRATLGTFAEMWVLPRESPLRERIRVDIQRLSI